MSSLVSHPPITTTPGVSLMAVWLGNLRREKAVRDMAYEALHLLFLGKSL